MYQCAILVFSINSENSATVLIHNTIHVTVYFVLCIIIMYVFLCNSLDIIEPCFIISLFDNQVGVHVDKCIFFAWRGLCSQFLFLSLPFPSFINNIIYPPISLIFQLSLFLPSTIYIYLYLSFIFF